MDQDNSLQPKKKSNVLFRNLKRGIPLYLMLLLPIAWYIIFCYIPMGGIIIAFQDYNIWSGVIGSSFADPFYKHFRDFLTDDYFWQVFKNTVRLGFFNTLVCFPAPIILALMFNELRVGKFKKTTQTISYLPYFVSTVAIVNIVIIMFSQADGLINNLLAEWGLERINFLGNPDYFVPIYVFINLWRSLGWGTIIYIAAMSNISPEVYEAAAIDGAGRFQRMWHITLPALLPTVITMLILAMPGILGADFETVMLLQQPSNMVVSDVVSTYIYRRGLQNSGFDYAAAIGLFSSVMNLLMIIAANKVSKKVADISIF